jgi:hypothetical protein
VKDRAPLFARPDVDAMPLHERCVYFAQQIADYEATIDGSAVLDVTDIRKTLEAAAEAVK